MAKLSFLNFLLIALCGQTLAVKLGGYKPKSKTDNYAVVKVDELTNSNRVLKLVDAISAKYQLDDLLLETKPAFMPGGWKDLKKNDTKVVKLAENAIEQISLQADRYSRFKLIEVIKVAYQVVAGLKYRLTFDLGETDCLRRANGLQKPLKECNLLNETHAVRCNVTIVITSWFNKKKIEIEKPCKLTVISSLKQNEFMKRNKMAFEVFKKKYSKTYDSLEEESKRFKIFMANQKIIKTLNKFEEGTATYGNTIYVDQTGDEFKAKYMGLKPSLAKGLKMKEANIPDGPIPASFDWREKKAVTEVKTQGSCGSCWAFSTTGNIEGQWAIKKKSLVSLSEQELVDCDEVDQGCNGGFPSQAYKQIIKFGGLETEAEYPYEGVGENCSFIKKKSKVYINDSVAVSSNETKMAQWLVKTGPISIGINSLAMRFYIDGVSHPPSILCNARSLNHAVLIVGYGVSKSSIFQRSLPYWIVKNSWGKSWGERGYYRVYRGDGTCGLNVIPTSAIIN